MPGEEESTVERTCLACGYNLFGLGDEPRCPECGLLNIPQGYRQQVWDLVDSGRWFFSGFFNPFAKRPPGWWWALDREGDLKRAFRAARRNILLAIAIVLLSFAIADAIQLEVAKHWSSYERGREDDDPISEASWPRTFGLGGSVREDHNTYGRTLLRDPEFFERTRTIKERQTIRMIFQPSADNTPFAVVACCWLTLTWAFPALVGLWTQIRRGLPDFAKPPHTIRAAAYYESHRLVYLSFLIATCLLTDLILRMLELPLTHLAICSTIQFVMIVAVGMYAATCWIGPLRSDYTKQLVRSRFHAGRIIIMYAALLPAAFLVALLGLLATSTGDWGMWYYWIM